MSTDTAITRSTRPRPRPRPSAPNAVPAQELLARAAPPAGGGRHSHTRRRGQDVRSGGFQLDRFPTIALSESVRSVLIWVAAFALLFFALYRINEAING